MAKPIKAIILNEMPYDAFVEDADGSRFVHASGRQIVFDDGSTCIEYVDDINGDTYPYGDLPEEYEKEEDEE